MRGRSTSSSWLLGPLLLGCAGRPPLPPCELPPPRPPSAALGPGDEVQVRVAGEPGLAGTYRVNPDGTLPFPLLGSVRAQGLEAPELERLLREGLQRANLLAAPGVSVQVRTRRSQQVLVLGAVQRPAGFPALPGSTVRSMLARAGGLLPSAQRSLRLTRPSPAGPVRCLLDLDALLRGRAADLPVGAEDQLLVLSPEE